MRYDLKRDGLSIAKALAEAATPDANYGHDDITPADIEVAMAKGAGPVWFAWSGTREDAVFTAITGNGPTSEANAMFFAHARDIVLELVAEVARLRLLGSSPEPGPGAAIARAERAEAALTKINEIRNSIVGLQGFNFSEHAYPLVAALNEAGFAGLPYPEARENVGTLLARAERAEAEVARLREVLRECVHVHNGTHSKDCHAFGAGSDEDLDPEATSPDPYCDCGATAKRESFRAALADSEKGET